MNCNRMRSGGSGGQPRYFQGQRGGGSGSGGARNRNAPQYQYQRGGGTYSQARSRPITYDSAAEESFQTYSSSSYEALRADMRSRSSSDREMLQMGLRMDELNYTRGGNGGTNSRNGTAHGCSPVPCNSNSTNNSSGYRNNKTTQRNLIINYLPQTFTDKDLFDLFIPHGPIQSVKIMKDVKTAYSYGFGFVNYHRDEDALKAIEALNGIQVENKRLKVSIARPPSDDIKDTNVYITNLPQHYDEHDLLLLFGPFGDIVQNHILRDKETHISRGAAFVRFDLREQASRAIITMNGFIPEGGAEPLRVKLAQDHGKQKAAYLAGFKDAWYRRRQTPLPRNMQFDLLNTH